MARGVYMIGSLVRITGTFTVLTVPTDPTTVTCKVKTPAAVTTTYVYGVDAALKKASTGIYYLDVDASTYGNWFYRFEGTAPAQAANEVRFIIEQSGV